MILGFTPFNFNSEPVSTVSELDGLKEAIKALRKAWFGSVFFLARFRGQ
jgi:hypothetical protein